MGVTGERLSVSSGIVYPPAIEPGEKIACRAGCFFCCHIPVECTEVEARTAFEASNQSDAKKHLARLKGTKFDPCVFLDRKTRLCTVYEHRPINCRRFTSVSRTACEKSHKKRNNGAIIPTDLRTKMYWDTKQFPGERKSLTQWIREIVP